MNKKAISPVLSILLLLLLSLSAFLAFRSWYDSYQDEIFKKHTQDISEAQIRLLSINTTTLTLRSFDLKNISYSNIQIREDKCSSSGTIEALKINYLDIDSCSSISVGDSIEVSLFTDSDVLTKRMVVLNE